LLHLGEFGEASKLAITTAAGHLAGRRPWLHYVALSDRNTHLRLTDSDQEDATDEDFLLLAGQYAQVAVPDGRYLSFVLDAAETDGTIYVTPVN
jgi:hypothetical protein